MVRVKGLAHKGLSASYQKGAGFMRKAPRNTDENGDRDVTITAEAAEVIRRLVEGGTPHDEALRIVTGALEAAEKFTARKPVMKGEMK